MLARHNHLCGGSLAGQAYTVCVSERCTTFALCCSGTHCQCRDKHRGHHMILLRDIMEAAVAETIRLPEDMKKMEKDIDVLLDELLASIENLKTKHRQHIHKHVGQHIGGVLMRKLKQREHLQVRQATGDCFHKLVDELSRAHQVVSPYLLTKQQHEQQLALIRSDMATLSFQVEQLWSTSAVKPTRMQPRTIRRSTVLKPQATTQYTFSSTHKHLLIHLQDKGSRVTGSRLALVEPPLSMNTVSKITLRVNTVQGGIQMGVCYRNRVQQLDYDPYLLQAGQGVYMHDSGGYIHSHSLHTDNNRALSKVRFYEGDVVTVELQPNTGMLTYSCKGKTFEQRTSIRSSTTQPVHFCVFLLGSDVSIVQ